MCHVSRVMCHMSLFNLSQAVRARGMQFSHSIHHTLCVMSPVSHVTCPVSQYLVYFVLQSLGVSWWRLSYRQDLPRLFIFYYQKLVDTQHLLFSAFSGLF